MKKDDPRVLFGRGVRALREARGLTQTQLAEKAGLVSWKFVGSVENARTNITLTNVVKFAAGLGVSMPELMQTCFPANKERADLLADLLRLVASEDDKTIRLLRGILDQVKKWSAD